MTSTSSVSTVAMLLADSRLPVGGSINSAGLEPALAAGLPAAQVREYMLARAATVSVVEAGTAVVTLAQLAGAQDPAGRPGLRERLLEVEAEWAARAPSRAVREVSRFLGRGYLRLALSLWPAHPAPSACAAAGSPLSRPVVLGALAAAAGLDAESLVRLVVYDDAQAVASALLKLDPMDPVVPVSWVLDACAAVEPHVAALALLTSPEAIPALGAPEIEIWAEAHSRTTQRLFRA
jgi:urease accessory protein